MRNKFLRPVEQFECLEVGKILNGWGTLPLFPLPTPSCLPFPLSPDSPSPVPPPPSRPLGGRGFLKFVTDLCVMYS